MHKLRACKLGPSLCQKLAVSNSTRCLQTTCCTVTICVWIFERVFLIWINFSDNITRLLTYSLIPCSTVLLENLTVSQLVKKFPAFYGTRRFITAFAIAHHLFLSWASSIQSITPHTTAWRSILILSSHLCLGLPNDLCPSAFPTKTLYMPNLSPIVRHAPPISSCLYLR